MAKTRKVILSIDFDFWSREAAVWDWGHDENQPPGLLDALWHVRYRHLDLYHETDPRTFADFMPYDLIENLEQKGLRLQQRPKPALGIADSHAHAYEFLQEWATQHGQPDAIVNLDAHHDVYGSEHASLHCGNWVWHIAREWPEVALHQVYPRWKDPEEEGDPRERVPRMEVHRWDEWTGLEGRVAGVFLCRSSAWVPPHLDSLFLDLARLLALGSHPKETRAYGPIFERRAPSREEAAALRKEYRAAMSSMGIAYSG